MRVPSFRLRVQELGFKESVPGLRIQGLICRVEGCGLRFEGLVFRVEGECAWPARKT